MKNTIVLKYGGHAMTIDRIRNQLVQSIVEIKKLGYRVIIVHGGGPFIQEILDEAKIESEFISGQRKTTEEALEYVEMALKGKVNGALVRQFNALGEKAVGLSGKDGQTVIASRRYHQQDIQGKIEQIDLGRVGNVERINIKLLKLLLENEYLPILTCLASDEKGLDYNINADVFAGHIAGAIKASEFIVLTDIDGLMRDINDPSSLIGQISLEEIPGLIREGTIRGGMIPKVEACSTALEKGARQVRIINGTKPEQLTGLFTGESIGTLITR